MWVCMCVNACDVFRFQLNLFSFFFEFNFAEREKNEMKFTKQAEKNFVLIFVYFIATCQHYFLWCHSAIIVIFVSTMRMDENYLAALL